MASMSPEDIREVARQIEPEVRRVINEVVEATKQTFTQQSTVIMEQRKIIEDLANQMTVLHDSFEPQVQQAKNEIGVEVQGLKNKQQEILDHLKEQLSESAQRDSKTAVSVAHIDGMQSTQMLTRIFLLNARSSSNKATLPCWSSSSFWKAMTDA